MVKALYKKNDSCNLLTLQQAVSEFNFSASTIEKLAKQCGAKLKIGRSARYQKNILETYLMSFSTSNSANNKEEN